MHERLPAIPRRRSASRHLAIVTATAFALAVTGAAIADDGRSGVQWSGTYGGVFAGYGLAGNQVTDVDGFANWGNAGWSVDYDDTGTVGGALAGMQFVVDNVRLRLEVDAMAGDHSATTNWVDPDSFDETAESELRWMATVRVGMEDDLGPASVFVTAGLAAARIDNSLTDIDAGPDMPNRVDPDDSFSDSTTEIGPVIGIGIEIPLTKALMLRVDGTYADFGESTHYVNRSADDTCGPANQRRPCTYEIENRFRFVRLAVIYRFGG